MMTVVIPACWIVPSFISTLLFGVNQHWFEYNVKQVVELILRPTYVVRGAPLIKKGILLSNHVSMYDAWYDIYANQCQTIGRYGYIILMLFAGLLAYIEDSGIFINRSHIKAPDLVERILNKLESSASSVLLYPEGTRRSYYRTPQPANFDIALIQSNLKWGTLLAIYRNPRLKHTPIQIVITLNKERTSDRLFCFRSCAFTPHEFESQEAFIAHILSTWLSSVSESCSMLNGDSVINDK